MKNLFIISMLLLATAQPALAGACYEKLTSSHTKDSAYFQLNERQVQNLDDTGIEYARSAFHALLKNLECEGEFEVDEKVSSCMEIVKGEPESEVCYLSVDKLGYFIVTQDYLENTNIIFSRRD